MTRPLDILFVDDDDDIRTIAALSLGLDPGFVVRAAGSGAEALRLLETGERPPDLVLLDVMMPGMDGPDLLARLRRLPCAAQIPIVFMTARARESDVETYLAIGAIGVITKPFDPLALPGQIRDLLGLR